jgi:hypothetical protein
MAKAHLVSQEIEFQTEQDFSKTINFKCVLARGREGVGTEASTIEI